MYPCVLSSFSKSKKVIPSILSHHETLPFKKIYIYAPKDKFRATTIEANHNF
jgi:hypothetical protein